MEEEEEEENNDDDNGDEFVNCWKVGKVKNEQIGGDFGGEELEMEGHGGEAVHRQQQQQQMRKNVGVKQQQQQQQIAQRACRRPHQPVHSRDHSSDIEILEDDAEDKQQKQPPSKKMKMVPQQVISQKCVILLLLNSNWLKANRTPQT